MHGEGVHAIISSEDGVRAVPLMYVEIDDRRSCNAAASEQRVDGHSDVVEDTKSLTAVGKGVVRPAGEVDRHALFQGGATGLDASGRAT